MTIPCYPCRDPRKNNNKPNQKCTRAAAFLPFFSIKPLVEVAAVSAQTLQLSAGVRNMPSHAHFPQPGLPLKGGKKVPAAAVIPSNINASFPKGTRGTHALQAATDTDSQMCCLCCSSCASRICCFVGTRLPRYFFGR